MGLEHSHTISRYLADFQSCRVSISSACSSSLCGMPGSTVDVGHPWFPAQAAGVSARPATLTCSMSWAMLVHHAPDSQVHCTPDCQ